MISEPPAAADCDALVELAVAEHRAGRTAAAQQHYLDALAACPAHPEANHNLAILLLQSGQADKAVGHFRVALENDADRELYWISFARALLLTGRPGEAVTVLKEGETYLPDSQALAQFTQQVEAMAGAEVANASPARPYSLAAAQARALAGRGDIGAAMARIRSALEHDRPDADQLLLQLGDLLAERGDTARAIDTLRQALARNPALAEAHHHLGSLLSENGQVAEGFAHFVERARLVHSENSEIGEPPLAHKSKHDAEQLEYLVELGVLGPHEQLSFHVADGARVAGPAVNPANAAQDLSGRWEQASPRYLVLDDFLMPEALDRLRRICAQSTIWKRVYDAGYIGATPEDGFACPLLAQIVEEIQSLYAPILEQHPFRYLGAFKYDSELSTGTNTHADFSAVNVNLYIAPDDACLAKDRGGMVIWDLPARSESELRYYNTHERELRELLESRGAEQHRVPHRANRAVIFDSSLYHKTDECSFMEGYLNKRINVSVLFGDWRSGTI